MPRTPSEWFAAAQGVYQEFLAALGTYGVETDPELRLVPGDGPNPYYEHSTKTIGIGMPDPDVPAGRLYWIFAARALGLRSVDEVLAVAADELPLIVAHEVTYHLRHHYHAPSENNYVEEQVANEVALAFLNEHPVYRTTVPRLREHSGRASRHLRDASPETSPYLPGFQPDLGEALVARGAVERESLSGMRLLADSLGEPLDVLFDGADLVPDAGLEGARDYRRETEAYFNSRYAADLLEYAFFHHEWLRLYLQRPGTCRPWARR